MRSVVVQLAVDLNLLLTLSILKSPLSPGLRDQTAVSLIVRYWCALVLCRNGEAANTEIVNSGEPNGHRCGLDQNYLAEDFSTRKAYCQGLEKRGLLDMLSSGEPGQLGFTLEWCRGN